MRTSTFERERFKWKQLWEGEAHWKNRSTCELQVRVPASWEEQRRNLSCHWALVPGTMDKILEASFLILCLQVDCELWWRNPRISHNLGEWENWSIDKFMQIKTLKRKYQFVDLMPFYLFKQGWVDNRRKKVTKSRWNRALNLWQSRKERFPFWTVVMRRVHLTTSHGTGNILVKALYAW